MNYEIEADWLLLTTCNFRCSYCGWSPDLLSSKLTVYATPEQWSEGFRATGKTWLLHITGGEPSLYPGFVDLCENLSRAHYLSINSNLSNASIMDFAERMDPARVHYINASLHPDERQRGVSQAIFIKHVQALQKRGFTVLSSVVMSPAMVKEFPRLSAQFEGHGLILLPKAMRGMVDGKRYPDAYTPEERSSIIGHLAMATPKYAEEIAKMGEAPTIDMFADTRFLSHIRDYRGQMCGSGYSFVVLLPNGYVVRCGSRKVLGNILSRSLYLLPGPALCDTIYCPYFCEKYTSPEFARFRRNSNANGAGGLAKEQPARPGRV